MREIEGQGGGSGSPSSPPPMAPSFAGTDMKAFARSKMDALEYEVQNYNLAQQMFDPIKVKKSREENWEKIVEARMRFNGGNAEDAIKFADDSELAMHQLRSVGTHGGPMSLRVALGGLESAFGLAPYSLITENADGTLSINYDRMKDTPLGELLNIGKPIGQTIDKAA